MATSAGGNVHRTITRRGLLVGAAAASAFLAAPATTSAAAGQPEARARLRELERSYAGRIGAFAIDTGTGATFGHRAYERFPLLSTFKVLASGAILRAAERDPGLLDRLIRWTAADLVPNSPVTELHVDTGLTIAELCQAAITRSDNTAGNLLLRQLGGPAAVTRFARTLGDPVSRLDRREVELNDWFPGELRDTTAPAAQAHDLRALTLGRALDPAGRARLLGWLRANTTGGARIRAGLPPSWTIGDKTGSSSSYGAANDIAVATPPSGAPLVLAIYTNRTAADAAYDNQVIADTATILATALGRL
jgi:beta-lactamase class A